MVKKLIWIAVLVAIGYGVWAIFPYVAKRYKAHIDQQTAEMAVEVNQTAKDYSAPAVNAARKRADQESNRMDNLGRTDP
jgi:anionic cell wall polymer biosynthesis LytR-Cps2A-Psr (LCP) family protein